MYGTSALWNLFNHPRRVQMKKVWANCRRVILKVDFNLTDGGSTSKSLSKIDNLLKSVFLYIHNYISDNER